MQSNYLLQFPKHLDHCIICLSRVAGACFVFEYVGGKSCPHNFASEFNIQLFLQKMNKKGVLLVEKKSHNLDPCPLTLLTFFASGTLGSPSWGGQLAIVGWKVMPIN